jgi:ketosteroid isomerase-like protein
MPSLPESEERLQNVGAVQLFFRLMHEKDIDAWGDLWNCDAQILIAYSLQGFPEIIQSKQQIVSAFRDLFAHFGVYSYSIRSLYPTVDPRVVIVEWEVEATLKQSGAIYKGKNITVFRFRDGKIAAYHDYFDPRKFQRVVDAIDESKSAAQ